MPGLLLDLDPGLGRRAGLERALRQAIADGRLAAGSVLPSTRTLAADLGLSRATVVNAYEQLTVEGYLVARQGSATRVSSLLRPPPAVQYEPGIGPRYAFDFQPGSPDVGLFPRREWLRSARRVIKEASDDLFDYGHPHGHPALRAVIGDYVGRSRAVAIDGCTVSVFGGFFSAIGFVAEALRRTGVARIAIEDPALFAVRDVMRLAGIEIVPVPVDADGIEVASLDRLDVGAVVVTPGHQYPLGMTLAPERRVELVDWARERGCWIVEDDYDGEFRYDRQPVGALQGLAPELVVYAGTTSKSLAPGLRLSWLVVPNELVEPLMAVKHLRAGVSSVEQATLADFIERGELDRHVRHVRSIYQRRRQVLDGRLASEVGWLRPLAETSAGLHLALGWEASDPASVAEAERALVAGAAERSIGLMALGRHWSSRSSVPGLVLGYTRPPEHRFAEAVDRLIAYLAAGPF